MQFKATIGNNIPVFVDVQHEPAEPMTMYHPGCTEEIDLFVSLDENGKQDITDILSDDAMKDLENSYRTIIDNLFE